MVLKTKSPTKNHYLLNNCFSLIPNQLKTHHSKVPLLKTHQQTIISKFQCFRANDKALKLYKIPYESGE